MHPSDFLRRTPLQPFLLLLLTVVLPVHPALAADNDKDQTISKVLMYADASVSAEPDMATFVLGVTAVNVQPHSAMQANSSKMERVLRFLRAKLPREQLQTLSVQLRKVQKWDPDTRQQIFVHYEATNRVRVAVKSDLKGLGKLIGGAIQAGADLTGNITFGVQDKEPLELEALGLATQSLIAKAQAVATASGYRLGRILNIQATRNHAGPLYRSLGLSAESASAKSTSASVAPIESGELTFTTNLSAEFELLR